MFGIFYTRKLLSEEHTILYSHISLYDRDLTVTKKIIGLFKVTRHSRTVPVSTSYHQLPLRFWTRDKLKL